MCAKSSIIQLGILTALCIYGCRLNLYQTTKFLICPNSRQKNNNDSKIEFVLGRIENIVGKGENAGDQHFLLFPQCFLKLSFPEVLEERMIW